MENKISYSFPISANVCRDIVATSRENPLSKGHSRYMTDFIKYFITGIRDKETLMNNLKLRAGNGLVYVQPKKIGTVFLRASAVCTECLSQKTSKGKYSITIKDHPFDTITKEEAIDYVRVFIEHDTHAHRALSMNSDEEQSSDDEASEVMMHDELNVGTEAKNFDIRPDYLIGEERDEV